MTLEEIKKVAMPACREFTVKRLDFLGRLRAVSTLLKAMLICSLSSRSPYLHLLQSDSSDCSIISKMRWGVRLICSRSVVSAIPISAAESSKRG